MLSVVPLLVNAVLEASKSQHRDRPVIVLDQVGQGYK